MPLVEGVCVEERRTLIRMNLLQECTELHTDFMKSNAENL